MVQTIISAVVGGLVLIAVQRIPHIVRRALEAQLRGYCTANCPANVELSRLKERLSVLERKVF